MGLQLRDKKLALPIITIWGHRNKGHFAPDRLIDLKIELNPTYN